MPLGLEELEERGPDLVGRDHGPECRRSTLRFLIATALSLVVGLVLGTGTAGAHWTADSDGFRLTTSHLQVAQDAGSAVFTIVRSDTQPGAQIRYQTLRGSAVPGRDYTPVKAMIPFVPGQASATFSIPIVDHGTYEVPRTVRVALFGPFREGIGSPYTAVLTIVSGPVATVAREPLNPLALPVVPPATDPLTGARPFVDAVDGLAAVRARQLELRHPRKAAALDVIAGQPDVARWGRWTPRSAVATGVSNYLARGQSEEPGTVPSLSTYWLVNAKLTHPHCGRYSDPKHRVREYRRWAQALARGIGDYRAILYLEVDSLVTVDCLSRKGVTVRMHELHAAIDALSVDPRLVVYLDAGAADALPARRAARLLRRAGIAKIQGFFLNATHFDWTRHEIRYGERISRMTGGKHFVINTAMNGRGPVIPHDRKIAGNEVLCNPPGRGLGPKPTFDTGFPNVDAFAWIATPGRSGGCGRGAPPTGVFWTRRAISLVRHADFSVR